MVQHRTTLDGARIVLGVSGGVSAYKAIEVCRELMRRGAHVVPVLTPTAQRFVTTAAFDALASERARTSLWDSAEVSPHTEIARRADLIVVAPATANVLAAARAGLASELLTVLLLASTAPLVLAPAMHTEMWEHPATKDNVATLVERGAHVVGPADGELAGGDYGVGRLAAVGDIVAMCEQALDGRTDLRGLHVLVSAGGTREPLDPVRFIGNRSSGRQGHAIAAAARRRGATVTLVTASSLPTASLVAAGVNVVGVESTEQLRDAMHREATRADVVIMAAAVADYRVARPSSSKLKRRDGVPTIELVANPVILEELVAARPAGQRIVGFAAETADLRDNARAKLERTGADLIVANDVSMPHAGFEHDTNEVLILGRSGLEHAVGLCSKATIADRILDAVIEVS